MQAKMQRSGITLLGLIILVLLTFGLRIHHLGTPSLWYDELLQLDVAQGPIEEIGPQLIRHAGMPLDYYLLHGWIKLGRQEAWVRFLALFFGTLTVPLIYTLGRFFFNKNVGYLAAILLTCAPFSVAYSQEVRPYSLLLFMVMITYWGLWQVYKTDQWPYWGLAMVGLVGAVLSHYFALFMLLPLGLFVAIHQLYHLKQKKFWQHTASFVLCLYVLVMVLILNGRLPYLYNVSYNLPQIISQPQVLTLPASEKPNRGSGPALERDFFIEKIGVSLATAKPGPLLFYNAFLLLAILSLLQRHHKKHASILLLLGWFILPILGIYIFLLYRGTFFAIRYILYTLPAYLILVAYGIDRLANFVVNLILRSNPNRESQSDSLFTPQNLLLSGLFFVSLTPLILAQFDQLMIYYTADSREDWRAVGQMLHHNAASNDTVIAVRAEPTINWYYPPASAPFGTYGRNEPIWKAINQHQRRWFVLSSYSFKRDKGLRDWLKQQGAVTIAIDRRVVVHFHQEGLSYGQMLAQVKTFSLPQKALTYQVLADQFKQYGDLETSQAFYQKAIELAQ